MAGSFRFIHASDFHLDEPLGGLAELPEQLIESLIEAGYRAADAVVDAAIRERVDFIVLSGDIIHFPSASPRAVDFLSNQFQRLHTAKIPTYWLGGRLESGNSPPDDFVIPPNVHRLATSRVQTLEVKKNKQTIAYVVGQSSSAHAFANLEEMRVPRDGRFFVGLWYCQDIEELNRDQLDDLGIDYWAFGGGHQARELETMIPSHFCGSPQGRSPMESGSHGCLLVNVQGEQATTHFLQTDAIRYRTERVDVKSDETREQLLSRVRSIASGLQSDRESHAESQQHILVTWEIVDDGPLGRELRGIGAAEMFLAELNASLSTNRHVWNIGLKSLRGHIPNALYDEDSILGDFLREIRAMERSPDGALDVRTYLPDTPEAERLVESLQLDGPLARKQLLQDVAAMGIDLLSGEPS